MVCNECNKSTAGVCVEHSSVMFKATQSFFTDAPGENAEAEGYPPIETERTAVSEVGRLRRLYEQTRDQRIRQAKEIAALKSRAEKAEKERDAARAQVKALVDLLREVPGAPRSHVCWLALLSRIREQLAAHEIAMRKVREDVKAARAEALEEAAKVPLNPEIVGRTEMARVIRALSSEAPAAREGGSRG